MPSRIARASVLALAVALAPVVAQYDGADRLPAGPPRPRIRWTTPACTCGCGR
ncbi:hypothetical protein [Streptomyces sp. Caat 7-52]|uniref:hypothetical protein n=1 Tax=Streptomyces sp. Caat 7-52 TaxID=2949637 RepID=UPI0020353175|nr:hypothetical protein [Streptomyces sp. Caat 7-52]